MRLLRFKSSGFTDFQDDDKFEDDSAENIPQYAILSHRWGEKTELSIQGIEYSRLSSLEKMLELISRRDAGNQQSSVKSSAYFWVDTCCIDKGSSNELVMAIENMSRQYRNAATRGEESHSESSMLELIATVLASGKQYDLPLRTDRTHMGSSSTCSKTYPAYMFDSMPARTIEHAYPAAVKVTCQNDAMWNQ
jgi:hypothetical protein